MNENPNEITFEVSSLANDGGSSRWRASTIGAFGDISWAHLL